MVARRAWVKMPVHATYGQPGLPELQVIRLAENIAPPLLNIGNSSLGRLNRSSGELKTSVAGSVTQQ